MQNVKIKFKFYLFWFYQCLNLKEEIKKGQKLSYNRILYQVKKIKDITIKRQVKES